MLQTHRITGSMLVRAATLAATLSVPFGSAQAQEYGSVAGRVMATESGLPLVGAQVRVNGTLYSTVTGEQGRYTLARVPTGSHTVQVTYVGRSPVTRSVTVSHNAVGNADFEMATITLTAVMVRASGQADALSRQQSAANIKNVVAADQLGRFPDASAPEAVQRLPGVMLQRDQGEGRYVQIRGSSAATTQVTINGEQIGSPEADARQIALDAIPVGVLGAVEVSKAITPDMDADAIGGSVNLITKQASFGRIFSVEGAGGYTPLRSTNSGLGAITYGDRSSDGRLGWLFSGSFGERNFGSDDIEPDYDGEDLAEIEVRHYTLWRRRSGFSGSVDFQPSDRTSLFLNGIWSELQDQEQRRRILHGVEDGELEYLHKHRLEKLGTFNVLAGAEHQLPRGLTLDYRVGVTRSQEDTPFDQEVSFLQEGVTFSPSRADPEAPQTNPQNNALGGEYLFNEFATGGTLTRNRDLVGALNLRFPVALGGSASGSVRIGAKYRNKNKDQSVSAFTMELDDAADDIVLGSDVGAPFSNSGFNPGSYPMPFTTSIGDVAAFQSRFAGRLTDPEADPEEQSAAYELSERVLAAYALAELNLSSRLMLLPGLRYEHTQLESDGQEFDADAGTLSPRSAGNAYGNVFPMIHMRYRASNATNIRAALTTAIFRPNFFDLVPYIVRDGEDIEQGNPDLDPVSATNFDLMLERYDSDIGLLSAGVFVKWLRKPIFVRTADNDIGGETSQPINAESGEILGFEVAFQKRFTSLPGALNGLGVYANYTWTDSKATQHNGRDTRLAGQAENAYNLALSYEKHRFSGQVSVNHVGGYIDELGDDDEGDLFADGRTQVDLSASYFVISNAQLFLEATNLGNAPYRTYQFRNDRVRQLEFYEPSLQVGLRFRP